MTPTLARMVGARANSLRKPVRWFSIPQLFRYERQQRGRLKEHFQLNMDIIGEPSVAADAEMVAASVAIMVGLNLKQSQVRVRVSDRRIMNAFLDRCGVEASPHPSRFNVFSVLDRWERLPREEAEKLLRSTLNVGVADRLLEVLKRPRWRYMSPAELVGDSGHPAVTEFDRFLEYTSALGVGEWIDFDASIVRGLAYYTGIVFELFAASGSFRAICGGGRYDDLLEGISNTSLPAVGFGMGDVVLTEMFREMKIAPRKTEAPEYWVAAEDDATLPRVMAVASRLRATGKSAEYALGGQRFLKQLETASKIDSSLMIILPPDLHAEEKAELKDLNTGKRVTIPDIDAWISDGAPNICNG
jgi:histidyl-tRNA synthetase